MVLAWENRSFLWLWSSFCCCYSSFTSFVDVFHFVVVSSFDFQATLSCHRHSTSSELYPGYFRLPFLFHLPRALRFWQGIFYPHVLFTLFFFLTSWRNLLLSSFHWEPAVTFLKAAGLHTDPRNTDPAHLFVWFTVIHNLLYILTLYSCISILQKFRIWNLKKIVYKLLPQKPHFRAQA